MSLSRLYQNKISEEISYMSLRNIRARKPTFKTEPSMPLNKKPQLSKLKPTTKKNIAEVVGKVLCGEGMLIYCSLSAPQNSWHFFLSTYGGIKFPVKCCVLVSLNSKSKDIESIYGRT